MNYSDSSKITPQEYQKKLVELSSNYAVYQTSNALPTYLFGLIEEVGEILALIKSDYTQAEVVTFVKTVIDDIETVEDSLFLAGDLKRMYRGDFTLPDKSVKEMATFSHDEMKKEIGDVLGYLVLLIDFYGYDLEEIMQTNLAKIERRQKNGTSLGSGDSR